MPVTFTSARFVGREDAFAKLASVLQSASAGEAGTLLGAAIARGPRRALGIELDPRWADVYARVVADLAAERDGAGPLIADLDKADPGGTRSFDPSGLELRVGDALALLPELKDGSVDLVATDPPYNIQLPLTMAGGALAETHTNRRTDYAMISDAPADLANAPDYATYLDRMEAVFVELTRVLRPGRYAVVIVRDAYQNGRYQFVGSDLAARADAAGLVPKGDLIWHQAGTRLRPYGYPRVFVPNIAHQHILVLRRDPEPGQARRRLWRYAVRTSPSTSSPIVHVSAAIGIVAVGELCRCGSPTTSPRVILWIQPWRPSGHSTSQ
jgi:16S rRNA G966 N2-methylase RsmD